LPTYTWKGYKDAWNGTEWWLSGII
jgi:hypothetical protein